MSVIKLTTHNFRNIQNHQTINFHPHINFISGGNGSGKSSIIEAIFLLGNGKSFRTHESKQIITQGDSQFAVNAIDELGNSKGISRHSILSNITLKYNGQNVTKLSEFARTTAVQLITPESFQIFFGGPKARRKFFDLGVFHVEHCFANDWRQFSHCLKQRNALLKQKDLTLLDYWTQQFCELAELITNYRLQYVDKLITEFKSWLTLLLPEFSETITLTPQIGWPQGKELYSLLKEHQEKEKIFGHTLYGPQKFDLKFQISRNGQTFNLEQVLSRGQQKLFLIALILSQTILLQRNISHIPVLLFDDFGAELDKHSQHLIAEALLKLDCQIIITAINDSVFSVFFSERENQNNYKMFHVKQGEITPLVK
jgi:DNA replication and repair protein RecF